ncbi:type II toxin-antitoxin system VapC family toxin, partial [Archaeoglobales archaeon]
MKDSEGNLGSELLIDTSILINYSRNRKIEEIINNSISVITLIEFLRYFRKKEDRTEAKRMLESLFNIVFIDNDVIDNYCGLYSELKEEGRLIEDADLLIAATAISKNLVLWTENRKHFERLTNYGL